MLYKKKNINIQKIDKKNLFIYYIINSNGS